MKLNYQSEPGQPGSFPLPNAGEPGQAFAQRVEPKGHPAARRALAGVQKSPGQSAGPSVPVAAGGTGK